MTMGSDPKDALLREALAELQRAEAALLSLRAERKSEVVICGLGCRLPGGVESPAAFAAALREGRDLVGRMPAERWPLPKAVRTEEQSAEDDLIRHAGVLHDPFAFDAARFGIPAREARFIDPQQRLLLQVVLEAFEDAGLPLERASGPKTGVYIGISSVDHVAHLAEQIAEAEICPAIGTGGALSAAAGRIAYTFGFEGPALAVDTACSSSLVALTLALEALRRGELDFAVVGGVNLLLQEQMSRVFARARMLSPMGRCKTFSTEALGYVRGEGAVAMLIARTDAAARFHLKRRAKLLGAAVNQDGRTAGFTVPKRGAQARVIEAALKNAGLSPKAIAAIEAHGTGTALGDPQELGALADVFAKDRTAPLWVASAKAHCGHLEASAGLVGLLKAVLSVESSKVFKPLHCTQKTSAIDWEKTPLRVPETAAPLAADAIIGVSSFGFTGTNAHVIVQGIVRSAIEDTACAMGLFPGGPYFVSGQDAAARTRQLLALAEAMAGREEIPAATARALALGRTLLPFRAAIFADTAAELAARARAAAAGKSGPGIVLLEPMARTDRSVLIGAAALADPQRVATAWEQLKALGLKPVGRLSAENPQLAGVDPLAATGLPLVAPSPEPKPQAPSRGHPRANLHVLLGGDFAPPSPGERALPRRISGQVAELFAQLVVLGLSLDLEAAFGPGPRASEGLPTYAFARTRFEVTKTALPASSYRRKEVFAHPYLDHSQPGVVRALPTPGLLPPKATPAEVAAAVTAFAIEALAGQALAGETAWPVVLSDLWLEGLGLLAARDRGLLLRSQGPVRGRTALTLKDPASPDHPLGGAVAGSPDAIAALPAEAIGAIEGRLELDFRLQHEAERCLLHPSLWQQLFQAVQAHWPSVGLCRGSESLWFQERAGGFQSLYLKLWREVRGTSPEEDPAGAGAAEGPRFAFVLRDGNDAVIAAAQGLSFAEKDERPALLLRAEALGEALLNERPEPLLLPGDAFALAGEEAARPRPLPSEEAVLPPAVWLRFGAETATPLLSPTASEGRDVLATAEALERASADGLPLLLWLSPGLERADLLRFAAQLRDLAAAKAPPRVFLLAPAATDANPFAQENPEIAAALGLWRVFAREVPAARPRFLGFSGEAIDLLALRRAIAFSDPREDRFLLAADPRPESAGGAADRSAAAGQGIRAAHPSASLSAYRLRAHPPAWAKGLWTGRHLVVTGASGGLGGALLEGLLAFAPRAVSAFVRNPEAPAWRARAAALIAAGLPLRVFAADLASSASHRQAIAAAEQASGPIEAALHLAGEERRGRLAELSLSDLDLALRVKLDAAQDLLAAMRAAGGGAMVLASSATAWLGSPGQAAYAAANAAVLSLPRAGQQKGHRISAFALGPIADAGMRPESASLKALGFAVLDKASVAALLLCAPAAGEAVLCAPCDFQRFAEAEEAASPSLVHEAFSRRLRAAKPRERGALFRELAAEPAAAQERITRFADDALAQVLGQSPPKDPTASLASFGFDSLALLSLHARAEHALDKTLPRTAFGPELTAAGFVALLQAASQSGDPAEPTGSKEDLLLEFADVDPDLLRRLLDEEQSRG